MTVREGRNSLSPYHSSLGEESKSFHDLAGARTQVGSDSQVWGKNRHWKFPD